MSIYRSEKFSVISVFLFVALLLGGCTALNQEQEYDKESDPVSECERFAVLRNDYAPASAPAVRHHVEAGQWAEMFQTFSEPVDPENSLFRERLAYLKSHPRHMEHILKNAEPHIFSVYRDVVKAGLPTEIIVIPMIESMYNPGAKSPAGYAGLWQFGSQTARNFGLKVGGVIDERFDSHKSTGAAVRYLTYLMKFFDGSWTMAVAGYNAGEGRVLNTYKGSGKKASQLDFNKLAIPQHTKRYLHSIMAYAYYLKNYQRYNLRFPSAVAASEKKRNADKKQDPAVVVKSIRYVSAEEYSRIHNLNLNELKNDYLAVEKRYVRGQCLCRLVLKGEKEPYTLASQNVNKEYVLSGTKGIVDSTVGVLEKYANGKTHKPGNKYEYQSIQDEKKYFSELSEPLRRNSLPATEVLEEDAKTDKPVKKSDSIIKSAESDANQTVDRQHKTENQNKIDKTGDSQHKTDKSGNNQSRADKSKSSRHKTDKSGNNQSMADKSKSSRHKTDKSGNNQSRADKSKSSQHKTDKSGNNQGRADKSKSSRHKTDKSGNNQSRADRTDKDIKK
jgi:hypothetical protein